MFSTVPRQTQLECLGTAPTIGCIPCVAVGDSLRPARAGDAVRVVVVAAACLAGVFAQRLRGHLPRGAQQSAVAVCSYLFSQNKLCPLLSVHFYYIGGLLVRQRFEGFKRA